MGLKTLTALKDVTNVYIGLENECCKYKLIKELKGKKSLKRQVKIFRVSFWVLQNNEQNSNFSVLN